MPVLSPIASGANFRLAYCTEAVYAEPGSAPAMQALNTTGADLNLTRTSIQSATLRSDQEHLVGRSGNRQTAGSVNFELQYGAYDDFLAAAFGGTWTGDVLTGGTAVPSFTLEQGYLDIDVYESFVGQQVNTLSLNLAPDAIVTGSFGFMGFDSDNSTNSLDDSPSAPATTPFMDSFSGVLLHDDVEMSIVSGLTLELTRNLTVNFRVGSPFLRYITPGRRMLTGTLTCYFESLALLSAFLNEETADLKVTMGDPAGNSYVLHLPKVRYTDASKAVSDESAIIISLPFEAGYDDVTAKSMSLTRTAA